MIKTMKARFKSTDYRTGQPIHAGDDIQYDTVSRKAWLYEPGDMRVSDVIGIGGKEFYRNKGGRCEDAPCCGCCTI